MKKCMGNCVNMFWYEILLFWSEMKYQDILTLQDVLNQPLLQLNSHIKYNKTLLYAHTIIHQGAMITTVILNDDLKSI